MTSITIMPAGPNAKETLLVLKKNAICKHKNGEALTLEETALAIWKPDVEKKPLSAMGVLKIERRALDKLKLAFKKYGIYNLDDIFDPRYREAAKQDNTREY